MKTKTLPSLLCSLLGAIAASAGDFSFSPNGNPAEYLQIKSGSKFFSINDDGLLTFQAESGAAFAFLSHRHERLVTPADEFELLFKTSGRVTCGIFLRGQAEQADTYMAFFGAAPDKTFILYFCKTKLTSSQQPSQTALAYKHFQNYQAGEWYRLRVRLKTNGPAKISFTAELLEDNSFRPLIELSGEDANAPLTEPGLVGFRFFVDKAQGAGEAQFKQISVKP